MSTETERSRLTVEELAARARAEMIPLTSVFSYFSTLPVAEDDLRQYLHDPIAALPPGLGAGLGKLGVLLVPYLERPNGKNAAGFVEFEKPPEGRQLFWSRTTLDEVNILLFGIREVEMADYHFHFYNAVANVVGDRWHGEPQERYQRLLRDELGSEVHGEVDDRSWHLKQSLRRQSTSRKETKLFRDYARQSFEDTLTLYLHGICCDIDVETGPRQMASRHLRRRLELLENLYPPPEGYAVFPEQIRKK